MAEWLKAPVLKTGSPKRARGFESLPLRFSISGDDPVSAAAHRKKDPPTFGRDPNDLAASHNASPLCKRFCRQPKHALDEPTEIFRLDFSAKHCRRTPRARVSRENRCGHGFLVGGGRKFIFPHRDLRPQLRKETPDDARDGCPPFEPLRKIVAIVPAPWVFAAKTFRNQTIRGRTRSWL